MGDATFAPGMNPGLGQALSVAGSGGAYGPNFVKIGGSNMTGMAWVYANSLDGPWNTIVKNWGEDGGQFHFGLGNVAENTLQNFINVGPIANASVTAGSPIAVGEWMHVAFVVDAMAGEQRLYLNGEFLTSANFAGSLGPGHVDAKGLGVGSKPNNAGTGPSSDSPGPWNGLIDEVALFDEALSQSDIQQIYRNGLAGYAIGAPVPEPATACVLLLGVGCLGLGARCRVVAASRK